MQSHLYRLVLPLAYCQLKSYRTLDAVFLLEKLMQNCFGVKQKKPKKMQNFKVAMFVLQQQKPGSNLSKHQKEQIQNRSNQELKDAFSLVTSIYHFKIRRFW